LGRAFLWEKGTPSCWGGHLFGGASLPKNIQCIRKKGNTGPLYRKGSALRGEGAKKGLFEGRRAAISKTKYYEKERAGSEAGNGLSRRPKANGQTPKKANSSQGRERASATFEGDSLKWRRQNYGRKTERKG